jgi:RNA polymerase sigma factor (sigma-70 family)
MPARAAVERLTREAAPRVLGALVRRYGHFDECEDAVGEALLAASEQWPEQGVPDNPRAWLTTVAARRLVDQIRAESARRRREEAEFHRLPADQLVRPPADAAGESVEDRDDTLTLLFLCCHPALTPASQVALTLRAVGGLSTEQIAKAFLVPEPTMGARISRAKQRIKAAGARFAPPEAGQWPERLRVVLHVLYLIFNEGYTASSGPDLHRPDLTIEAIRLARAVHQLLPDHGEMAGLLALMLLTDARRPARTTPDGALVPLAEQDRSRWDRAAIAEGTALVTEAMSRSALEPYQLQAAIAAVHVAAEGARDTDWAQIQVLYQILERISPNPMVTLNRAVAVAMTDGPRAGLALLAPLEADTRLAGHHRLAAVRAHLLEMAGDLDAAREAYRLAARCTASLPERRYLTERADHMAVTDQSPKVPMTDGEVVARCVPVRSASSGVRGVGEMSGLLRNRDPGSIQPGC